MPCLSMEIKGIQTHGPLIEIVILPSKPVLDLLEAQKAPLPVAVRVTALIDTGASSTVIKTGLPEAAGLKQRGLVKISTPSCSGVECRTFDASVLFPLINAGFPMVTITEAPLEGQNIGCLLGRDILDRCLFVYEGFSSRFSLSM